MENQDITVIVSEKAGDKPAEKPSEKLSKRICDEASERYGLLDTVQYIFDEYGFVDWRSLIPKGYLFINAQKFKEQNKDVPTSLDGLEDSMIIIKLGGIKWLAKVRGYEKVSFQILPSQDANVVVKCQIDWIPNFENPLGASYEEIASCNVKNANEFNLKFAESIAANRAFVRCVRNFLNINIVGEEEILTEDVSPEKQDKQSSSPAAIDPQSIFLKIAKEKGLSFQEIVDFCASSDESLVKIGETATDDQSLMKALTPKLAKKLLKIIKNR